MTEKSKVMLVLEEARDAAIRTNELMAKLGSLGSQQLSNEVKSSEPTDQAEKWVSIFDEIDELSGSIRMARDLLSGIAYRFGQKYAEPLRLYYLEGRPSWKAVTDELKIPKSTLYDRRAVALEWAESVGYSAACEGYDTAFMGIVDD